ncbi:DNA polymerase [Dyella silvatica]|uniref:DNA polymerase n=1 Tax=Dyella silvatica TaxID=2992128 RepID=UPI002257DB3C|nr:DNA polymerase [Dyella silvatica]
MLMEADAIGGHNIIGFDIPAIQKVYPWFKPKGLIRDTLIMSRLIFTDLVERDFNFAKKTPTFGKNLIGSHALEAWGIRLGEWKGDYAKECKANGIDPWARWNQEMDDYCLQDVVVTWKLWEKLLSKGFGEESIQLEHDVAPIIERQTRYGFLFDVEKARKLEEILVTRRTELADKLREAFPPWEAKGALLVPKRDNKAKGYIKGVPIQKYKTVVFNPASRDHIANRLTTLYGWKPVQFTDSGKPKVDETTLEGLKYPEAELLTEYLMVEKRIGQLSEGKQAWFKSIKKRTGRIHGRVTQNGAVTGRMTHSSPNLAQVPSCGTPYGEDCRELFCVPKGKKQVGADASGLELRNLAHFMAKWDGGEYAKVILEGDIHTVNQCAAGLPTRNNAKTFIYAFLYGAGDAKIGSIVGKGRLAGTALKKKFLSGLPALNSLLQAVKVAANKRGYLIGLDGRKLHIRSDHAALNTLLQSAGAVVMKKALVILDRRLQELGYVPGVNYEFIANIHDEFQIECDEDIAEIVGKTAVESIRAAGDHFGFRCPLDGEYKIGNNWKECH